jgi:hypothetical protein
MSTHCVNCGISIEWQPTIINGRTYCCLGCSRGGPCECDYALLPREADSAALVPQFKVDRELTKHGHRT